ncbi:hypothetical protein ONS95_004614 [Cadophora gregata]|uniref:uncharacterized protein n=1 Tax=Cadophora gregata TaxID=51156 RepID=UPI0026DAB4BB|nr:uncharacterized protein ONS95_004614 [Cadophora gregata]KAK0105017.1 hypothetical protein ONS96_004423 [Cadophora gregata f. sp. sojae]KAK0106110.1 hypothetical protein ONS95_004614 [Cadophora gregata]
MTNRTYINVMRAYNFTSTVQKILGFQSAFKSSFNFPTFHPMSSSASTSSDPDINRTISYWFDGPNPMQKWFQGGASIDQEIREQFLPLVERARAHELTSWTQEPRGSLALIVLLDQFPRNLYRGSPLSYSSDSMALDVAAKGIAKGHHKEVTNLQMQPFYLPLMHHENLVSQIAATSFYESLITRCESDPELQEWIKMSLGYAERHRDCILKFGRFPSRNEILGRISTPEEIAYLKEYPSGF